MKSMQLKGIRQMHMVEVEIPQINKPTDVLIKMKVLGVCGSDIHYYVSGRSVSFLIRCNARDQLFPYSEKYVI